MLSTFLFRPESLEPLVFGEWKSFFRLAKPNQTSAAFKEGLPVVPVITPADQPLPADATATLPAVVTVTQRNGVERIYRLQKRPRVLDWSPKTAYSELYLFTVRTILQY